MTTAVADIPVAQCQSVSQSVTYLGPAKTAEQVEVRCGVKISGEHCPDCNSNVPTFPPMEQAHLTKSK